jgi:hypothetical protein
MANPTSVTVNVVAVPTFSEVMIPSTMKGEGVVPPTTGNGRTPSYAMVKFTGLQPNTVYTYITAGMLAADVPTTYNGAGTNLYYNYLTNSYSYTSSALNLADPLNRSTFKTGASETTKTLWVNIVPSSNSKFNVGNAVVWVVYLGNEYGEQISRNATTSTSLCSRYGTTANDVTGLYDLNSRIPAMNFLVFYDNLGKAITSTIVQNDGAVLQDPLLFPTYNQGPAFYANIDNAASAWGTFIPNTFASGIAKIEQFDMNGASKFVWTDPDGIWAGVNTANPNKGSAGLAFQTPFIKFTNLATSQAICNTGTFDFKWDYNGVQTVSIQVSLDGGTVWQDIVSGYPASDGHFSWLVQRVSYSEKYLQFRIFSDEHTYIKDQADNVQIFDTPVINKHSKGDVYCKGTEVTIEVVAIGTNTKYQWYRDGVLMTSQTLPYLYFQSIDYTNTGIYHCEVSGPAGSGCATVRTGDIVVYVARPTAIAKQPQAMFVNLGASAFLEVDPAANGIPATYKFYYQWYADGAALKDDARIQGTAARKLVFNSVVFADLAKKYFCKVTALCGTANSDTVMLSQTEITIVTQPKDKRVCEGTDVVITADVQNNKNVPVTYNWMKGSYRLVDNLKVSGSNTTTLTLHNVKEADMGSYYLAVEMEGKDYKLYSNGGYVYVVTVPVIYFQTPNQNLVEDKPLNLVVKSKSTTTVQNVSWKKDGVDLPGYTTTTFYKQFVTMGDAGTYVCTIQNECGTAVSQPIVVKVTAKGITSVEELVSGEVVLDKPVPNPANNFTNVAYALPSHTSVNFTITDMFGKTIATFDNGTMSSGTYNFELNVGGLNLPSGIYFINLYTKFGVTSQKLIVLE